MAQDISMSSTTKGIETINNLFTVMEGDTTPNHTKVQAQKGKKSLCTKMRNKMKGKC
jgi:hypothetical protein